MKLDEKDKLIALGYLYQGKSPKEVEEICHNVSYAQALRLKKDLEEAKKTDSIGELFDLEEAALESLLENVKGEIGQAAEIMTGDTVRLDGELDTISRNVQGMQILESEMSEAAAAIVKQIKAHAVSTKNIDNLVMLAEALSKLQTAFFKNSSIQIANFNNEGSSFEKYLKP